MEKKVVRDKLVIETDTLSNYEKVSWKLFLEETNRYM